MIRGAKAALREVRTIVVALGVGLGASLAVRRWSAAAILGAVLTWVFFFFRDPERYPEDDSNDAILAPADGRITKIEVVEEPRFMHKQTRRITVFLSIFDVHVQRSPYAGAVDFIHYQPGRFAPAFLSGADENEANFLGLETLCGPLLVTQMAGILARRIVCWASVGDDLVRGQRLGLVKFGSRVDLYLPLDAEVLVKPGQQVYGGQTVMARWASPSSLADNQ